MSKFKNQSSAPQTISGSMDGNFCTCACLRCLRSLQAAMKRLCHVNVIMTLTSSGAVIRGLPDGALSFSLPGCRKRV